MVIGVLVKQVGWGESFMDRVAAAAAITISLISGIIAVLYVFTKVYLDS